MKRASRAVKVNRVALFQLMVKSGFTVDALAKKIGVKRQTVYLWLEGTSFPTLKHLYHVAFELGVNSIDEIVEFADNEQIKNQIQTEEKRK